jgi:signal transduction histidine kinase
MRSLRTWLALGLVLAMALPAATGALGWLAASRWQAHRDESRQAQAKQLLANATIDTPGLASALSRLGLEAQLQANLKEQDAALVKAKQSGDPDAIKKLGLVGEQKTRVMPPGLTTPGFDAIMQGVDGKRRISKDYASAEVAFPGVMGTLFIPRASAAPRIAAALAAAAIGLAAALALAVSLLQRWVLRPLAVLSADADRIAGGELEVAPVQTRASEVAQVAEALHGMAGALGSALGAEAAAERDRRFLVSAIAHDLRTPLFTLRGSLEAIERGIGNGDALARAQRKADHLDRLVGDLFAFSRAEYAREGHAREELDLAEIARRAVEPGEIALDVVGDARVLGDPVALQRVLTNLLDNALRHAKTWVRVEVRAEDASDVGGDGMGGTRAVVVVTDDGPGFAPEDLPHVFEPLYRGDKARGGGGAGLGLAIARRLVRAHGGDVEAANAPAGGAIVTVTLPCPSRSPSITSSSSPATGREPATGS